MDTVEPVVRLLESGGALAALVLILITGVRGDWVFGRFYTSMQEERDEWKRLALDGTGVAERALSAGEAQLGVRR
jgi:hypothetical protein